MTGSLDDHATLKLKEQEDKEDKDLLLQAAAQVYKVWLPLRRPDCPGIAYPQER